MASYSFGASLLKSQLAGYRMAGNPGQQEHKIVLSTAIQFLHCPHHNVEKVLPHKFQKPIVIYNISDQLSDLATHPMMNLDVRDKYTSPMRFLDIPKATPPLMFTLFITCGIFFFC